MKTVALYNLGCKVNSYETEGMGQKLRENGYIEVDAEGFITLTPAGHKIAARIYGRHKLLTEFFVRLGVSQETAAADACKVEHDLSEETFEKLLLHAQKNSEDPGTR